MIFGDHFLSNDLTVDDLKIHCISSVLSKSTSARSRSTI